MKKIVCMFLALLMCASLFAACGGEKEMTENQDLENGALSNDEQNDKDAVTDQNQNLEDGTETDMEQNAGGNDFPKDEKQKAPIIWSGNSRVEDGNPKLNIDRNNGDTIYDIYYDDNVPEDYFYFIYNYKETDQYYVEFSINVYLKDKPALEDMSEEYQEKYCEFKNKYGGFNIYHPGSPEKSQEQYEIISMALKELDEKFEMVYKKMEFDSSVLPRSNSGGYFDEEGSDLSYGYYLSYTFTNHVAMSNTPSLEDFVNWEWSDLNKLAELEWIEKIEVFNEVHFYSCV